jgi:transcriptional regulator with XRE-family HTH domain
MTKPSAWWRRLIDLAELAGDVDGYGCPSQQDIARRIGVSDAAVSGWKWGTEPRPDAVRKAAKAYHDFLPCNTDELLRELLEIAYMSEPEEPEKRIPKRRT